MYKYIPRFLLQATTSGSVIISVTSKSRTTSQRYLYHNTARNVPPVRVILSLFVFCAHWHIRFIFFPKSNQYHTTQAENFCEAILLLVVTVSINIVSGRPERF